MDYEDVEDSTALLADAAADAAVTALAHQTDMDDEEGPIDSDDEADVLVFQPAGPAAAAGKASDGGGATADSSADGRTGRSAAGGKPAGEGKLRVAGKREGPSSGRAPLAASYALPEVIRNFILYFYKHIKENNLQELRAIYETHWVKLSERYFKASAWPPAESIAHLVDSDGIFLLLYKELYYRHVFAKFAPTLEQAVDSWHNYVAFFRYLRHADRPGAIALADLPYAWLWDMVDGFVGQTEQFSHYRATLKGKRDSEVTFLRDHPEIWSVSAAIAHLQGAAEKPAIAAVLRAEDLEKQALQLAEQQEQQQRGQAGAPQSGGDATGKHAAAAAAVSEAAAATAAAATPFSSHPVFRRLGYFALVGLLRLHCSVGDYSGALAAVAPIPLSRKGLHNRVTGCHLTLSYYMAFAHLMSRHYVDAVRSLAAMLLYLSRTMQYHVRSAHYDTILRRNDQMLAMLAVCLALCPTARVDEHVASTLNEKHAGQLQRLRNGELSVFGDLFSRFCPRFFAPCPPTMDELATSAAQLEQAAATGEFVEVIAHQTLPLESQRRLFLAEVAEQALLTTLRSFLKLYTTISVAKLADFMDVDEATCRVYLMCYKHRTRAQSASGAWTGWSDVSFVVDGDLIHVQDVKPAALRYGDYFARQIAKFNEIANMAS